MHTVHAFVNFPTLDSLNSRPFLSPYRSIMKVSKPSWITHQADKSKTKPVIYSLHIRPDGTRLATAGQDAEIKIWNMEALTDSTKDSDPTCPKLLSSLKIHSGSVLAVRWSSGTGRYLASGSDDQVVMIWELDSTGSGRSFGSTETIHETWKPVKRLAGHGSDVTDLQWAHDNRYLASCSLDCSILIWDGRNFEKLQKLDLHAGYVKGLTWDPAGKFLASQSDDRSMKIWRTSDWKPECSIDDPFRLSPTTTFFRRPSWSPDGTQIVVSNAVNGSIPVSTIIKRHEWGTDNSLVGHDSPTEVAAFNPRIFALAAKEGGSTGRSGKVCICAVGSQDNSISIWSTNNPHPIKVLKDVASHSILDLAWHPDGRMLAASSFDGTVLIVEFDEEIFGQAIKREDMAHMLEEFGPESSVTVPAESTAQLDLEDAIASNTDKSRPDRLHGLMNGTEKSGFPLANRVALGGLAGAPGGEASVVAEIATASKDFAFSIPSTSFSHANTNGTPAANDASAANVVGPSVVKQTVTVGKGGKKRIQPQFLRSISGVTPAVASETGNSSHKFRNTPMQEATTFFDSPTVKLSERRLAAGTSNGLPTSVIGNKRKPTSTDSDPKSKKPLTLRNLELDGIPAEIVRPARLTSKSDVSQVRLATPGVIKHLKRKSVEEPALLFECDNTLRNYEASKVTCARSGEVLWVDYLPSPVVILVAGDDHTAAATEEGGLYVWSPLGKRILPCMMLGSTASLLDSYGRYLLVVTAVGLLSVWDVPAQECIVDSVSVAPLLQVATLPEDTPSSSVHIVAATLRLSNGTPSIVTSAGEGFTYHIGMNTWMRTVDASFAKSDYYLSGFDTGSGLDQTHGPLSGLEVQTRAKHMKEGQGAFAQRLFENGNDATGVVTLRHLETQMASSIVLESPVEYLHWLKMYARRISDQNSLKLAEDLCAELAGDLSEAGIGSNYVLDLSREGLLSAVLPILGQNRTFQRIVADYQSSVSDTSLADYQSSVSDTS